MNKKLSFVCIKIQRVIGCAIGVTVDDIVLVSEFEIEHHQQINDVKVLNGKMSSEAVAPGNAYATCKGWMPFISAGGVYPPCTIILQAAGFTVSEYYSKFTFTRSKDEVDVSIRRYDCQGAKSLVRSIHSVIFTSIKIIIESGKIPRMEFTGKGLLGGVDTTTLDTVEDTVLPEIERVPAYSVNDVDVVILDTGWGASRFEIELINAVTHKPVL